MWILIFVLLLVLVVIFRAGFVVIHVSGDSMNPVYESGDRVLVLRWWPRRWLTQGQIVVFRFPVTRQLNDLFSEDEIHNYRRHMPYLIKRVVGLPGETVYTRLSDIEDGLRPLLAPLHQTEDKRRWPVPEAAYFLQGDSTGIDSTIFGPVPAANIIGPVVYHFSADNRQPADVAGVSQE